MLVFGCQEPWPDPVLSDDIDAIVVLGNRPPTDAQGNVRPETERRVRRGVELFDRGAAPLLVMTGGPAPRGDVEAEVMRDLAVALGVPSDAILIEPRSRDTIENARLTRASFPAGASAPHVIVVTSPSHLGRASRLFECAGFQVTPAASAAPENLIQRLRTRLYETAVALYYLTIDECLGTRTPAP